METNNSKSIHYNQLYLGFNGSALETFKIEFQSYSFLVIDGKKIIKIEDYDCGIFLGWESVNELWNLLTLILYRIDLLKSQGFNAFYDAVLVGVSKVPGDVINNITDLINAMKDTKSENLNCMMVNNLQPSNKN